MNQNMQNQIQELIVKNLPSQTANELSQFITEAEENKELLDETKEELSESKDKNFKLQEKIKNLETEIESLLKVDKDKVELNAKLVKMSADLHDRLVQVERKELEYDKLELELSLKFAREKIADKQDQIKDFMALNQILVGKAPTENKRMQYNLYKVVKMDEAGRREVSYKNDKNENVWVQELSDEIFKQQILSK